jgi:hypothetical protein
VNQIWQNALAWVQAHPTTCSLFAYHFTAAFVGSLEMPDSNSGKLYKFFFRLTNRLAANYSRAQASSTTLGEQAPKTDVLPPAAPPKSDVIWPTIDSKTPPK